jgi:hypothetical protein
MRAALETGYYPAFEGSFFGDDPIDSDTSDLCDDMLSFHLSFVVRDEGCAPKMVKLWDCWIENVQKDGGEMNGMDGKS